MSCLHQSSTSGNMSLSWIHDIKGSHWFAMGFAAGVQVNTVCA